MKFKLTDMALLVCVLILLQGCSTPELNSSVEEFQKFYTETWWYFDKPIGIPKKIEGWNVKISNNFSQVYLTSPRGIKIMYEERVPTIFALKKFHGYGQLKRVPGFNGPIFEVDRSSYFQIDEGWYSTHFFLIGFAGSRCFEIAARFDNENRQIAFDDALFIAKQTLVRLLKK